MPTRYLNVAGVATPITGGGSTTPSAPGYDVVLLAGQSNMVGTNNTSNAAIDVTDPDIWVYATVGSNAGTVVQAADPLTHHSGAAATVGPGMEFARWYRTIYPNRRVLLVPAAHSGTAILSGSPRWDPTTGWANDANNLYNLAITQAQAALTAAGANSNFAAVLWLQGESDAIAGATSSAYRTALEYIVDGFRSRLSVPTLPFIIASMLPEFIAANSAAATPIDGVHVATPTRKAYTAFVRGPSGTSSGDALHYAATGARALGRGMAAAYLTALANTSPASAVAANPPTPPTLALTNTVGPAVTGTASVGSVLTTTNGTWSAAPDSYTYQWNRAGSAISGATANTYTLVSADSGVAVTCTVTAVKAGYTSGTATSNAVTVGGTAITDTFTRADSTTTLGTTETGGKTWTVTGGPWGISSNQAYNAGGANNAIAVFDVGAANHTVQAKIAVQDSGSMILLRYTDANNFVGIFASGGTMISYIKSGGNGTFPTGSTTCVAGDTIKAVVNGSTVTYYRNGTQVNTFTTSLTGTMVGIRADSNAARIDDFSASAP